MIKIPPNNYCIIKNPVEVDKSGEIVLKNKSLFFDR